MSNKVDILYKLVIEDTRLFDSITDEIYDIEGIDEIAKMIKNEVIRFTEGSHRNVVDMFISVCVNSYINSITNDEWKKLAEKVVKYFSE